MKRYMKEIEVIDLFEYQARKEDSKFDPNNKQPILEPLKIAGLFAGIGGVELGLQKNGHKTKLLCEIDSGAIAVLKERFKNIPLIEDVKWIETLDADINTVTGGFPCQDLSQAGRGEGIIRGKESSLVGEIFRILTRSRIDNIILENVPFMLSLDSGMAMNVLTSSFEELGYAWAYRVVDSMAFGVPQRRRRVIFFASRKYDPRDVLFADEVGSPSIDKNAVGEKACGFYFTEGFTGLGWAVDAVPPIKGGSSIGIPSPPAICLPNGVVGTPDIKDAERMQGFPADWSEPASTVQKDSLRWQLVGNAVTVDVFDWMGARLRKPESRGRDVWGWQLKPNSKWPGCGWNVGAGRYGGKMSLYPMSVVREPLADWLDYPLKPLSARATAGFLERTKRSSLRFPDGFIDLLERHLEGLSTAD